MFRRFDGPYSPSSAEIFFEKVIVCRSIATATAVIISFLIVVFIAWATYSFMPIEPRLAENPNTPKLEDQKPDLKPEIIIPAEPKTLEIARINVTTVVQQVGQTKKGAMDVPDNTTQVGWYKLGYLPGQIGNAVITGHLDNIWMNPAVFANLNLLEVDDEIIITDINENKWMFKIIKVASYPVKTLPIDEIFGPSNLARLNLITCSGKWSWRFGSYSERIVVYSELINNPT